MQRMIAVLRQRVQAKLQNYAASKTRMPSAVKTASASSGAAAATPSAASECTGARAWLEAARSSRPEPRTTPWAARATKARFWAASS